MKAQKRHMHLRDRRGPALWIILLILLLWGTRSYAQEATPISLEIKPVAGAPGFKPVFSGNTAYFSRNPAVTITVTPQSGAASTFKTAVAESGEYTFTFPGAKGPGDYKVQVVSSDGKGKAAGTFRVIATTSTAEESAATFSQLLDSTDHALDQAEQILTDVPPSDAKTELEERLKDVRQKLASRSQDAANFRTAVQAIQKIPDQFPDSMPAFEPILSKLDEWSGESREEVVKLNAELIESAKQSKQCEKINAAIEGVKLASAMMNFASTGIGIIKNFLTDFLSAKFQNSLPASVTSDRRYSFASGEVVKVGRTQLDILAQKYASAHLAEVGATTGNLFPSLLYDLAAWAGQQFYGKYCEKFEGPMSATLSVEFFNKEATVWWKYTIEIQGKLTLRYGKPEPGQQAIKVAGEFFGSGTKFTCWENAIPVLFPKVSKGAVMWSKVITPIGVPFTEVEGRYAGALGPRAFFIPVEGDLVKNKLSLRILPAKTDFEGVTARSTYLIVSVLALVPVVTSFPLPYKGAQFVITRALDAVDKPVELQVKTDSVAKKMTIEGKFSRPNLVGDGNRASYTMNLMTCNPPCQ